jgi:hypothetical protein
VQLQSPNRQAFPGREVEIPDVERYELDLDVGEASVSGVVVDADSGAPVPEAMVSVREPGTNGAWKGGSASGADGRFALAAEPGEYVLEATARGRKRASVPLTVGPGGASDLRLELEAGVELRGRVVDRAGKPAPDADVFALDAANTAASRHAEALPDGTFRIDALEADKAYTLVCGEARVGFGMRHGVTPGADPVAVTLHPGGKLLVRVLGPDGLPVKDAWPRVVSWDGVRLPALPGGDTRPTETPGVYELPVPAAALTIEAGPPKTGGSVTVQVAPGGTASVDLVLKETPAK